MSAIIENCYNAGIISSGGGIIGENKNGNIKNCYYDISKSNKGYVSSNSEEIGIIGKTTLEMKSENFINLLNSDIFSKDNENENKGYPIIQGLKCNIDYSIKIPTNQNVIVTPHVAYETQDAIDYILEVTFIAISDIIKGGNSYRVN